MKIDWKKFNWNDKYVYYGLCLLVSCLLITATFSGKKEEKMGQKKAEKKAAKEEKKEEKKAPAEAPAAENPMIRVLLRGNGFVDEVHPSVSIQASQAMIITSQGEETESLPGEVFTAAPDHPLFQKGSVRIRPKEAGDRLSVLTLKRGTGAPSYRGTLELTATAEGIAIVNELPLEDYLCGVVPSEMPSSYEKEALKCQAVCARSYAVNQMKEVSYPEYQAHVDDSTAFQVYGNSGEAESSNAAVAETAGKRLIYNGQVATAYYYSTSCGRTTDMTAWGSAVNAENAYLSPVSVSGENGDYEKELAWYRWDAAIPKTVLGELISLNTKTQIGTLTNLQVTKTGAGEIALQITATGTAGSVTVDTENKIRRALGGDRYQITRQDGNMVQGRELLPSAFFTVEDAGDTVILHGGGFGHGIGMSQNGANEMAKQGKTCEEILQLFYPGTQIG